jgi:hypothetical protein
MENEACAAFLCARIAAMRRSEPAPPEILKAMSTEPTKATKPSATSPTSSSKGEEVGVRIFTWPKIIFIFPTLIAALVCGLGMWLINDNLRDPTKPQSPPAIAVPSPPTATQPGETPAQVRVRRFTSTQNILGMIFLGVFFANMIILALDFPRFTIIAGFLALLMFTFLFLWINAYYDLIPPLVNFLEGFYCVANAEFYFMIATILLFTFALIWVTRWLDYWEILPNEILHHHGPLSELERYPTFNLRFDKEIPDVLEFLFFGAGKLILHVANENRSFVLESVLFINQKEAALKRLMGSMEVRETADQGPVPS